MKITVLIENTAPENLVCEHGLSFLIEFENEKYLLDAGKSELFLENAKRLGISLQEVKTCVLSHGHYDHSGGFHKFFSEHAEAMLYLMKGADGEYYSSKGELHEISVPKVLIDDFKDRFITIEAITKVAPNVYLVPHSSDELARIGERAGLHKKVENQLQPDDFAHELSLVFDTKQGLVIFNSCSHGGVKNIICEVQAAFPKKKLYAFVGGLHMKGGSFTKEEIQAVAVYAKEQGIEYLYTGHCTGDEAYAILKEAHTEMIQKLISGMRIEIDS